jgi:V/A-type H+/Na+-transporting ATPase subunit I
MLRPERMLSTSIICLRKDIDATLEVLNEFGYFHTEQAAEKAVVEYDLTLLQVEEATSKVNQLIEKLISPKVGLIDFSADPEPNKVLQVTTKNWQTLSETTIQEINSIKREEETISSALAEINEKNAELQNTKEMLARIEAMGADLEAIEELKLIQITIAEIPKRNLRNLNKSLTRIPAILHKCYLTKETEFICLAVPAKFAHEAERILKNHHAQIFFLPKEIPHNLEKAEQEINKQLNENYNKKEENELNLKNLVDSNKNKLFQLKETSQNILILLQAKRKILHSERLAIIKGFVPQEKFHALTRKIESDLKGNALILQNQIAPADDPPTKFRNNRFVKPFEEITRLYGLPHYNEIDPTPIIAISFPILFGLMFGDIGHGLILLMGGLALGFLIKKQSAIKNMCWILAACGVGAIFAGVLFGEFFGKQIFLPLWFSPFDNVLTFLIFSLFVGVVQITSGLVIELFDFVLNRNVVDAVLTSIPKILFYVGAVYLVAVYKLNFGAWFRGPILLALIPFLFLVFGRPIVLRVSTFSWNSIEVPREKVSLAERFFESSDLVARLLSNTMSYTRILALLMAHWALILVTYVVAGLIGSSSVLASVLGYVVIIGGNIFVIALEGLIVFIHVLRLHFYEWFSKFYKGNGTQFSPFKQKFILTRIFMKEKAREESTG